MFGAVTREKAIHHAQHLDLIYSQADTLYNIIPHVPQSLNGNIRLAPGPHANDVVSFTSSTAATQLVGKLSQMTLSDNPTSATPITTATTLLSQSSEVNFLQITVPKTSQQPGSKKRNNNNRRKKNYSTEPTGQTNQESNVGAFKVK